MDAGRCICLTVVLLLAAVESVPVKPQHRSRRQIERDENDGRLPRNIIPTHYNLELQPDIYSTPDPPFYFTGSVDINIICLLSTNAVVLNVKDLDFTQFSIIADPNSPIGTPSPIFLTWSYDPTGNFLTLEVVNGLVPGAWYIVHVSFNGQLRTGGNGLYWDSYVDTDGSTKYMVATQMESIEARTAFPSFDEPDLKATFNITVVSQPPSVTLSNMPVIGIQNRSEGWVAYTFAQSPIMSSYQVCIAVGDFIYAEALWENVTTYPVRIYARPQMAGKLDFAAKVAPLLQAWLEQETGIPYMLPKMDHIALPSKGGAMENWGLITYGEDVLCVDPETSAASGIMMVTSIIAHELAHQWYGNLVTAKWWDDIWLNEGFATFYNYYPQLALGWQGSEAQQADSRRGTQQFLDVDQQNTSDPIRKTVDTVWRADSAFSGSTYPKGGAVIRMMKSILSETTLRGGLSRYLTKYSYSSATTDDLWAELTAQAADDGVLNPDGSAVDVKNIMDAWMNQMGYPVLMVNRNGDGTATVVSRRFLSPHGQSPDKPSNYSYSWNVPITVASQDTTDWDMAPIFWLPFGQTTTEITGLTTGPGDWIMINAKQMSFYRVQYDNILIGDIVNQLLLDPSVIPTESKAQLIDDTFALARAVQMPLTLAMDTTQFLGSEMNYNSWGVALKHFQYMDPFWFRTIWHSNYELYIVNLLFPIYDNLGWSYTEFESPLNQYLRRDAIMQTCYWGFADCRDIARTQYAAYIANPDVNSILSNNLPTVLCVGVAEGFASDWSTMFDQYQKRKTSPIREERYAYLFAMACSSDTAWHDRLLSYIVGGVLISPRDANTALFYMTQSRVGRPIVFNYLSNSWNVVPSFINKMSTMRSITQTYYDSLGSSAFNNFVGYYPPTSQSQLESFIQMDLTITQNIDFVSQNADSLMTWLDDHLPRTPSARTANLQTTLPISPMVHWDWLEPSDELF